MDCGTSVPSPRGDGDGRPSGSLSPRPVTCPAWCTLDHLDPGNEDDFHYGAAAHYTSGAVGVTYVVSRDEACADPDRISLFDSLSDQCWTPRGLAALGRALIEVSEQAERVLG